MDSGFRPRLQTLRFAVCSIALSAASLVLFITTVLGAALVVVWVGIPIFVVSVGLTRKLADHRRARVGALLSTPVESPYLREPEGNLLVRARLLAADPALRRDLVWLLIDGTAGQVLAELAVIEGLLDLLFWWLPPSVMNTRHARLDRARLGVSEKSRLALRVQQLTESRAETVDTQAAELRRIERDLHDGAQARLVSLGMSLALAEQQLAAAPDVARALLTEARTASSDALAELRDLVRGIHPPVLADRGLVGAVQALALAVPVPVEVHAELDGRLPAPVESAGYFAVAEGLANVVKHASAQHIQVTLRRRDDLLELEVHDDGVGGANAARGTGLRGIERRLAAFDGALTITSPPGGPTVLAMVLPCTTGSGSSSPKISPSSGTA